MSIKIFYQNVRGLRTKSDEFYLNLLNIEADIFCLTETWLNSTHFCSEFLTNKYISHRRDRNYSLSQTTRGGGAWIFHRTSIISSRRHDFETNINMLEDVWIEIKLTGYSLFICTLYITPANNNAASFELFLDKFKDNLLVMNTSDRILLVGDFNVSEMDWILDSAGYQKAHNTSTLQSKTIMNIINLGNLNQFNSILNESNKILDLVLSNDPINSIDVNLSSMSLVTPDLYHPPLAINISESLQYLKTRDHKKLNFRKGNYEAIKLDLMDIDWNFTTESPVEISLQKFYRVINNTINKNIPRIKSNNIYPHWFNKDLINTLKQKEKSRKEWKKHNSSENYSIFSNLRKLCKKKITSCYSRYLEELQTNIHTNIKQFWAFTKKKKKTNTYPSSFKKNNANISSPKEICNLFADFFKSIYHDNLSIQSFNIINNTITMTPNPHLISHNDVEKIINKLDLNKHGGPDGIPNIFWKNICETISKPLSSIFNNSLNKGIFPDELKTSYITPIFKKGDYALVTNYRPVCMLNSLAIIFEKAIHKLMLPLLEDKICPQQHGFASNKSTGSNLIEYTSYISEALDRNYEVHSIYTDFSKAFDTVDHCILLKKLQNIGINSKLLKWFQSYLSNRSLSVTFNGSISYNFTPTSGVPQGSVLGPILFNIFINDLNSSIQCKTLLYADDTKIFTKITSQEDIFSLQNDINKLQLWCINNKLKLNIDKCQYIVFSNKKISLPTSYTINNVPLNKVTVIRDLGVLIDSKLKFEKHIDYAVNKAYKMLGFLMRTTVRFLNIKCIISLYNALVRSHLEYNSSVWSPYQTTYVSKIEKVQKRFTRQIHSKFHIPYNSYENRLQTLKMSKLELRREYFDICLLNRVIKDNNSDLNYYISYRDSRFNSRNGLTFRLNPCTTNYGLYTNPLNRAQNTYNNKYKNKIDISDTNINRFKSSLKIIIDKN